MPERGAPYPAGLGLQRGHAGGGRGGGPCGRGHAPDQRRREGPPQSLLKGEKKNWFIFRQKEMRRKTNTEKETATMKR